MLNESCPKNVIQTNAENTLSIIDDDDTKAMGVLYSGSMKEWFESPPGNHPNDSRVLFWALQDEPDSGPAKDSKGNVTGVTLLKDLYNQLYWYKGYTTTKPSSLNIMHVIFIEEFSKGCDLISADPFVRPNSGLNQARISDCVEEMKLHVGDNKTLIILWWWDSNQPISTAISETIFAESFDEANNAGVDGIGGWNFSGSEGRLNQDEDLWDEITDKNDSV